MDTRKFSDDNEISRENIPDWDTINSDDDPVENVAADQKTKNRSKTERPSKFIKGLYDWISAFLFALVLVFMIITFCFRLVDVDGSSMYRTLQDENKVLVTGLNYEPAVGDIVVISHGVSLDKAIVKRVIAVGGQTVDINSETGEVIVDGIVLDEPYIKGKTTADGDVSFPVTVDEGKVFVLGDNRPISKDSRFSEVGLIENENIIGKVCYRVYPFNEFGTVE